MKKEFNMIKLIPMDTAAFDAYLETSTAGYAEEHVKTGNWDADTALEKARKEFDHLLPEGLNTKNNHLFSILAEEPAGKIGVLWVGIREDGKRRRGFIYDFVIDEQHRGKGYGKQALAELDIVAQSMQVDFIDLHVFAHNTNAIELYKKMGYQVTNMYMRKTCQK